MSMDPNSLMIFKSREEDDPTSKKSLKGAKETLIYALPEEFSEVKGEAKLGPGQAPEAIPAPTTPTSIYSSKKEPEDVEEKPLKKAPAKIPMGKSTFADSVLAATPTTEQKRTVEVFSEHDYKAVRGPLKKSSGELSREAAKKHTCVWHPWREAYAVCEYCHRPFCFEDTVEFNKSYYCLEDIDSVSVNYNDKINSSGNKIRMLSGIMLVAIAIAFFYLSAALLATIIASILQSGLPYFIANANFSYIFALVESIFMIIALANGLALVNNSRKAMYFAIFICLGNVALFAYQFSSTGTLYLGAIAVAVFLSLVVLLYSRTAYVDKEAVASERQELQGNSLKWSNVGQF